MSQVSPGAQGGATGLKTLMSKGVLLKELLQALGIFQRATPDQLWKLTRPDNQHDKLTRDNLLNRQDHRLVRIDHPPGHERGRDNDGGGAGRGRVLRPGQLPSHP
ncbi:hypothetical protein ACFY71_40295, partial [Streptomyces cinerochromogenes]|uniref:hypothetical protein n=1 Tax=Streptomyces cinerochromogenes TaxID=66422 RepID=UPI00368EDEF0